MTFSRCSFVETVSLLTLPQWCCQHAIVHKTYFFYCFKTRLSSEAPAAVQIYGSALASVQTRPRDETRNGCLNSVWRAFGFSGSPFKTFSINMASIAFVPRRKADLLWPGDIYWWPLKKPNPPQTRTTALEVTTNLNDAARSLKAQRLKKILQIKVAK